MKTPAVKEEKKVALVTGGARRLGRHIALALAEHGFDVAISYRHSAHDARRTLRELRERGSAGAALRAELTSGAQVKSMFASIKRTYKRLDVLIGNAGVYPGATPLGKISERDFQEALDTNLKANFLVGQHASALMRNNPHGGAIVYMASLGGLEIWRDRLPYNVSKAALIALTRAMARAVAPFNITVNAIAPGHIEMADEPGAVPAFGAERVPMLRFGAPADIARAVLFFVESAPYITGEVLAVDGGMHLKASNV